MLPRLLSFVVRAMAIAQLTQLNISIPASGAPPGQVPAACCPGGASSQELTSSRRASFASSVTVLGDAPPPVHSPESSAQELLHSAVAEEDVVDMEGGAMDSTDTPAPIIPPPPGFRQFSWPNEDRKASDDPSLFTFMKELPGWFPWNSGGLPVDMPSLPLSPIVPDSLDDSVTANMGSPREESITPSEVVVIGDVLPEPTYAAVLADSPLPTAVSLLEDLLWAPIDTRPQGVSGHGYRRSPSRVPRWRLAREDPFLAERSPAAFSLFWRRMRFSKYLVSGFGLCFVIGRIRYSLEPSALLGVDRRSGVGHSAGDGTWEVD